MHYGCHLSNTNTSSLMHYGRHLSNNNALSLKHYGHHISCTDSSSLMHFIDHLSNTNVSFPLQGSAKLEKAEILQMTVDHLKVLHSKGKQPFHTTRYHDSSNALFH